MPFFFKYTPEKNAHFSLYLCTTAAQANLSAETFTFTCHLENMQIFHNINT